MIGGFSTTVNSIPLLCASQKESLTTLSCREVYGIHKEVYVHKDCINLRFETGPILRIELNFNPFELFCHTGET